jgi:synaptojanin
MEAPGPTSSGLWGSKMPAPEKSSKVMIRDYPHRAIAIVSHSYALIFRHSHTTSANGSSTSVASARSRGGTAKCMVEFSRVSKQLLADYRPLTPRPIYGTLGLISINQDVFLCVITQASRVAMLRPGETVERIRSVEFFCLNTSEYDDILSVADPWDSEHDTSSTYGQGLSRREAPIEHPCQELQKLLSNGSFYYSTDFDLTNRLQDRPPDAATFNIDQFDESFLWNSFMIQPLVQFRSRLLAHEREALDASWILTSAIRGFCSTMTIPQSTAPLRSVKSGMPSYLSVISRLSCRRAGTRFNSRGIDDDGNVANFVETETIFWSPSGVVFSYAQVRGSVPVFWEQAAGLLPGHQKITITRSLDGAQPAFNKHFEDLEQSYGAVHVVNLLSRAKESEVELSQYYQAGLQHCPLSHAGEKSGQDHALLTSTEYDFHAETKGPSGYEAAQQIRRKIENSADGFAYYLAEEMDDSPDEKHHTGGHRRYVVVLQQEGVFRTNCLDCLDRTNLIQTIISQMAVESFLGHRAEHAAPDFWMRHSTLWADNGDNLSRIYAGTGALKSSFTRHGKMSLAGAIADARKSATRLYINNFADKGRQNTIDMLLGRIYGQSPVILYDPINDFVTSELNKRRAEFSSSEAVHIWVGTFNLNGRTTGIDHDLSPWLSPAALGTVQPEIFVVGFQEIVELSPQQIMNSDPSRKQQWEKAVRRALNARAGIQEGEQYVLLRSGQLVGAALCVFVKRSVLPHIKNVEGSIKKTGLSGMAGNKGAVAIRLDYDSTSMCFVTAHLAAGFPNYDERNRDYATIHHGLRFQRNRGIDDHDSVIWLGDFNYRIGLSREDTMALIKRGDLESLYANDQLNLQMVAGLAFPFYSESRINFMPTYRFDIGTDTYDSSEKQRIPAWTDRILRKGNNVHQLVYDAATALKFSDHRPVYAIFECMVNMIDESERDRISHELYSLRKSDVGNAGANTTEGDTDDEDLMGYDAIEPGLPPASSDRRKWWLDNGKPARSQVRPPGPNSILNPNRPGNPFVPTDEPDWIEVPNPRRRKESESSLSTSPFEHIDHAMASGYAAGAGPRRLPPPYNQSQGSIHVKPADSAKRGPPAPPPRRQTGAPTKAPSKPVLNSPSTKPLPPPRTSTAPNIGQVIAPARQDNPGTFVQPEKPPTARSRTPAAPPRSASAASRTPAISQLAKSKSPPPPVAKKPAHLATSPPSKNADSLRHAADEGTAPRMGAQGRASVSLRSVASKYAIDYESSPDRDTARTSPPPKPPRRTATAATVPAAARPSPAPAPNPSARRKSATTVTPVKTMSAGAAGLGGMTGGGREEKPRVATRKPSVPIKPTVVGAAKGPAAGVNLMDDDASGSMGSWKPLKPA